MTSGALAVPPHFPPAEVRSPGELAVADIGGTNARFALATIAADGAITLAEPVTLATSDFVSLRTAWDAFALRLGRAPPAALAVAIAAPVTGAVLRMTNNSWTIDTGQLAAQLGLKRAIVINDFAAVAHAAASVGPNCFEHLCGPETALPPTGTITVVGPGTGLGVAYFRRFACGGYQVQATEGGHMDFAPVDRVDDAILARLRARHRRVSVERVVAGPAIVDIRAALADLEHRDAAPCADAAAIWLAAEAGDDPLATAAVDRFCMALGSVAGDYALAHGAGGVVIAGGVALKLRDALPRSGFAERFRFKGRYQEMMAGIPVKLITHPQPGLFGAAAAFAKERAA